MPSPSRRTVAVIAVALATVVAAVALPLLQPWRLFTDKVVEEALPGADPVSITTSSPAPPTVSARRVDGPVRLTLGRFVSHEHDTVGTASVLRLADGSRILRLEGLDTSDGPDLEVWLSDAPVIEGRRGWHIFDDGHYRGLGQLKGNR
ncbi:MAG TPA: DM13 domain-containing protein, partial [Kribbella sp.]|nr:DM13 domain-containing protein [Kribbella sp.]